MLVVFEKTNVYNRELHLKIHGLFPFRLPDINLADQFSYEGQYEELCSTAPLLKDIVAVTAVNPKSDHKNILKKSDTLIPCITNAVSILLFCGNQSMNANTSLNSLILRRGKADKMCWAFQCTACMPLTYMNVAKAISFGKRLSVASESSLKRNYKRQVKL